jgi:hypothetical protein
MVNSMAIEEAIVSTEVAEVDSSNSEIGGRNR